MKTTYAEIMAKMVDVNSDASVKRLTVFMAGIQDCVWENVKEIKLSWSPSYDGGGVCPHITVVFKENP